MVNANKLKDTVNAIINDLGSDIIINRVSTVTYDKWGDPTPTGITVETIKGAPINYFKEVRNQGLAGVHSNSDCEIIVKGDETILFSDNDYVTYLGVDYTVDSVEPFPLQNVILAQSILLSKKN